MTLSDYDAIMTAEEAFAIYRDKYMSMSSYDRLIDCTRRKNMLDDGQSCLNPELCPIGWCVDSKLSMRRFLKPDRNPKGGSSSSNAKTSLRPIRHVRTVTRTGHLR